MIVTALHIKKDEPGSTGIFKDFFEILVEPGSLFKCVQKRICLCLRPSDRNRYDRAKHNRTDHHEDTAHIRTAVVIQLTSDR